MRQVSPGRISLDSSTTRKLLNDPLTRTPICSFAWLCSGTTLFGASSTRPSVTRSPWTARTTTPSQTCCGETDANCPNALSWECESSIVRCEESYGSGTGGRSPRTPLPTNISCTGCSPPSRPAYPALGGWVVRRPGDGEEEFVVMTLFGSLDAIRAFAGDDYETPVIEPEAARLLVRGDEKAAHYEAVIEPS